MRIILLEAFIVSLMAGAVGYLVGMGVTRILVSFLTEKLTSFTFDPLVAVGALLLAVVVGMAASLYPAAAASRMDPSEALRTL